MYIIDVIYTYIIYITYICNNYTCSLMVASFPEELPFILCTVILLSQILIKPLITCWVLPVMLLPMLLALEIMSFHKKVILHFGD